MTILGEYLASINSDWEYDDSFGEFDGNLITCCGIEVELDAPRCPECHASNPIRDGGLI